EGDFPLDTFFAGAGTDGLTPATAHVIEGIEIDGTDELGNCIYLSNTTRYLVIRNCTLWDPTPEGDGVALNLQTCSNVTVLNCDFPGTRKGIQAYECESVMFSGNRVHNQSYLGIIVERSSDAMVYGNRLDNSNESIIAYRCDNTTVELNRVTNSKVGIRVTASRDCFVYDNEVTTSSDGGIKVQRSRGLIIVSGNKVQDSRVAGINVANSEGVEVLANEVRATRPGVYLYDAEGCLVQNNNITDGDIGGIRLVDSFGNTLSDNEVISNWQYGMDLTGSDSNDIVGNRIVS
ncbi:MAG: hypothetical protein GWN18_18675, partial [Thermoplasmata archaeon]|nr:hypothetical protein [Thermoplasmata archaeon]NIS14154.1 hypothetical protein [Thermoplasmata archaeon]NIS21993.1 hypothetical protein [Thermoplasmata archaeon]NIT79852.1 hypothetical protein [Thermoplasmata archaeon]NIU51018.1 hypothetical protein [Thermoplasmata archaeon]